MEGNYPVSIKGENCGTLTVTKEGPYTRFSVDCAGRGEVIRLSVYGGGKEGYLGVPLPEDGRLKLDKKLSPAAMKGFPALIERCSLSEEKAERMADEKVETVIEPMVSSDEAGEKPDEPESKNEDSTFWYATTDGALVSHDGDREMVALPPEDERVPKEFPGEPRIIEGKEYLVYITKEMRGMTD